MSTAEVNGAGNLYPDELMHSSSNEQTSRSYNRKRSVQYPNEYESSSYTPKHNRMDTSDYDIGTDQRSSRQTFPPFRITLKDANRYPTTELSIIKEINKYCKLNLTYGRYKKTADNQMCFLLCASTKTQFEHLMCETNWSSMINNKKYKLDLPNKIPPSYSIIVQNFPSQWSAQAFGNELKQHYPSIELSMILKSKRILLEDDNTAFAVEPYLLPTRILRCYNCQVYDDHIAAHCPNKNNPVCFRCAHYQGDHSAGNSSCPVKSEKRHEKNQRLKTSNETSISSIQQHKQP